jgi:hypothetical protein
MNDARGVLRAVGLLAAGCAVFAGDSLWGGSLWLDHDLLTHHYPWRAWAAETWAAGELPLWAPVAHGFPLFADGQTGVLYPVNMALYVLLPVPVAYGWSVFLHQLWAAVGAFTLARVLERSTPAALVAGVSYGMSGFLVTHLVYLGMFEVVAWLPWMVALGLYGSRHSRRWWAAAGMATGMAWLAGHPQAALYATLAAGFVWLWHGVEGRRRGAWWGVAALVLGAAIGLPQIWASLELAAFSPRAGGVDASFAAIGSLPLEEALNGLVPTPFGLDRPGDVDIAFHHRGGGYHGRGVRFWETSFYLGIPAIMLALVAGRVRRGWPWWALAAVSFLWMLGDSTPLYAAVRWLPGVSFFRFPARAGFVLTLAVGQLAAVGVDRLGGWLLARPVRVMRVATSLVITLVALLLTLAVVHAGLRATQGALQDGLATRMERPDRSASAAAERARGLVDEVLTSSAPWSPRVAWPVGLAMLCAMLVVAAARRRLVSTTPGRAAAGLLAVDLMLFGLGYNTRSSPDALDRPALAHPLMGLDHLFRVGMVDRRVPLSTPGLLANTSLLWGLEDVVVPSPLRLVRNEEWLRRAGLGLEIEDGRAEAFASGKRLADISGVRFVASAHELELRVVKRDGPMTLYENDDAFPRAWAVGCTRSVRPGEALDAVLELDDARREAVVEGMGLESCHPAGLGEVVTTRTSTSSYAMQVTVEEPAFLVLAESWYPGQRWTVDGERVDSVRANHLFQGVVLQPGVHAVTWAYLPLHLYGALGVSWLALMGGAWLTIRRESSDDGASVPRSESRPS